MQTHESEKFQLEFIPPYSTFQNGKPATVPFVVSGLLTAGGFSVLGAKPKTGKSSLSRALAVAVTKGESFLGRSTEPGEVFIASLEDPRAHVDNALKVLGYSPKTDACIHRVEKLPARIEETVETIGDFLTKHQNVNLVILDTLAKVLRVRDLSEYVEMMSAVEKLKDLARRFPKTHLLALAHCKKIATDDPFDALLGSVALRAEPDTNIVIYERERRRVIESEGRMTKNITPTLLDAELIEFAGYDIVKDFSLGLSLEQWTKQHAEKTQKKKARSLENRIIEFLADSEGHTATEMMVLDTVKGKTQNLIAAIDGLTKTGVLKVGGIKNSPTNPTTLTLDKHMLALHQWETK